MSTDEFTPSAEHADSVKQALTQDSSDRADATLSKVTDEANAIWMGWTYENNTGCFVRGACYVSFLTRHTIWRKAESLARTSEGCMRCSSQPLEEQVPKSTYRGRGSAEPCRRRRLDRLQRRVLGEKGLMERSKDRCIPKICLPCYASS